MDEALKFDIPSTLDDRSNFRQRKFASEYNAPKSHFLERKHSFQIMRNHLSRGMKLKLRKMAAAYSGNADILHDDRIRADFGQPGKQLYCAFDIIFVDDSIKSYIYLLPVRFCIADYAVKFIKSEIGGECPRGKIRQTAVYSIGSSLERGERGLEISGRS